MIVVVSPQAVDRPSHRSDKDESPHSATLRSDLAKSRDKLTDSNGPRDLFAFYTQGLSGLGTGRRVVALGRVVVSIL